jgi:hypothetical protein
MPKTIRPEIVSGLPLKCPETFRGHLKAQRSAVLDDVLELYYPESFRGIRGISFPDYAHSYILFLSWR